MVYTRSEGTGCPYCTGRKVTPKQGGFVKQFPLLTAEWDVEKNTPLTPQDVTTGSHKLILWRCPKGHSWRAAVYSRTTLGTGCPVCTGRQALAGENDLATLYPDIAAQWDEEKNGVLHPNNVTAGSNRRVWWQCEKGHSYRAIIAQRVQRLSLLREPQGVAGVQRPLDRPAARCQGVARITQRRADAGDGDCRKPQKSVVTMSLRPHVESGYLRPHRRAAKRLPRLRREDKKSVNPARGGGQKIKKTLGGNGMKRRLLASILSLVMMLSLLSTAVWAREMGSGGSQETEDTAKLKPQSGEEGTPHETATSKELDLADGSIVITETGYTQDNAESETAYSGEYTISGTTTENTITVTGGDHTIKLNGVNIDVSGIPRWFHGFLHQGDC